MPPAPRTPRPERATIEDVAVAAGVSVATVSRALRGLPNVANSTRERVRAVAEELAYRPDPAAARLATGRSQAVAVAVPVLNGWYFANVVAGIEAVCADAGFDTVVLGVSSEAQRDRLSRDATGIQRRVDGIVLVDIGLGDGVQALVDSGLKVVTIGPHTGICPSVGIDDVEVGRLATQYLIHLGHRRIGVVAGHPDDPFGFVVPHHRAAGYRIACETAGVSVDPELLASGNFSIGGAAEAVSTLLDLADPPTAIFAMSDEMAFGAIEAARERGLDIPGDMSVIGVDDHDTSVVLGLTTVHQDVAAHGARAARLVLRQIVDGDDTVERVEHDIQLIIRDTTGPLRRSSD